MTFETDWTYPFHFATDPDVLFTVPRKKHDKSFERAQPVKMLITKDDDNDKKIGNSSYQENDAIKSEDD